MGFLVMIMVMIAAAIPMMVMMTMVMVVVMIVPAATVPMVVLMVMIVMMVMPVVMVMIVPAAAVPMVVSVVMIVMMLMIMCMIVAVIVPMVMIMVMAMRCSGITPAPPAGSFHNHHIRFHGSDRFLNPGQHSLRVLCTEPELLCGIGYRDVRQFRHLTQFILNLGCTVGTVKTFQNIDLSLHLLISFLHLQDLLAGPGAGCSFLFVHMGHVDQCFFNNVYDMMIIQRIENILPFSP